MLRINCPISPPQSTPCLAINIPFFPNPSWHVNIYWQWQHQHARFFFCWAQALNKWWNWFVSHKNRKKLQPKSIHQEVEFTKYKVLPQQTSAKILHHVVIQKFIIWHSKILCKLVPQKCSAKILSILSFRKKQEILLKRIKQNIICRTIFF
jgi:ribosomal protein L32E